ncbi:unnamed protein product [Discula destructiva]
MGQPSKPIPSPASAATPPPLGRQTIDASRTEIFFLAVGVLSLVVQLIFIIWFCVPRAFVRRPLEQRTIAWQPVKVTDVSDEDNDRSTRRRRKRIRRSSTWNGRTAEATGHDGYAVRRRKSSGTNKPVGLRDAVLLSGADPDSDLSDRDISVLRGFRDARFLAASLASPMVQLSPRRLRSPLSNPEAEIEDGYSEIPAREMHLMPPNTELPAMFSPRSPRLGPIHLATAAVLKRDRRKSETTLTVSPRAGDEKDVADGFDDPLGVNRRKTLFGDESGESATEELRRGSKEGLLVGEDTVPIDGQPRRRRTSH